MPPCSSPPPVPPRRRRSAAAWLTRTAGVSPVLKPRCGRCRRRAPPMPAMANMPGMNERTAPVGADGSFSFDQVAPGQYVLFVDATGFERSSQQVTAPVSGPPIAISLVALDLPGAPPVAEAAGAPLTTQALLDRIEVLERRLSEVESTTVLSEPETRVRAAGGVRRSERQPVRYANSRGHQDHDVSEGARLSPADDQRKNRRGAGGCRGAQASSLA